MQEFKEPFKKDKKGIWYVNGKDVLLKPFKFTEISKAYVSNRQFYFIDGVNDYVVKDTTLTPLLFNRTKTFHLLKQFMEKDEIENVDYPIGYCKQNGALLGTIVPYYKDSISIKKIIYLYTLADLAKYYHHDNNEITNLISLLLDILNLISTMYDNNIIYVDIHSGNFLIYENSIKVIDFEPGYVHFSDNSGKYFNRIINNYKMLVETICRKLKLENYSVNKANTFMEMEKNVKSLEKRLER